MWPFSSARSSHGNEKAREMVKQGALLLDVRTPAEYASGHVDGAVNIPVQELGSRMKELGPKTRPVVVYCRSGGRSASATSMMRSACYDVLDVGPMTAY